MSSETTPGGGFTPTHDPGELLGARLLRAVLANAGVFVSYAVPVYRAGPDDDGTALVVFVAALVLSGLGVFALFATLSVSPDPQAEEAWLRLARQLPGKVWAWIGVGGFFGWYLLLAVGVSAAQRQCSKLEVVSVFGIALGAVAGFIGLLGYESEDAYRSRKGMPARPRPAPPAALPPPVAEDPEACTEYDRRLRELATGVRVHYLRLRDRIASLLTEEDARRDVQWLLDRHPRRSGADLGGLIACAERCAGNIRERYEKLAIRGDATSRYEALREGISAAYPPDRFDADLRDHLDTELPLEYLREAGRRLIEHMERLREERGRERTHGHPTDPVPPDAENERTRRDEERAATARRIAGMVAELERRMEAEIAEVAASGLERTQTEEAIAFIRETYASRISEARRDDS